MTSWLRAQKKSDLVDIAETVGLKNVASLKKSDLETSLDEYLTDNASQWSSNAKLSPYFNIRSRSAGSPVKKELSGSGSATSTSDVKVPKRRQTKAAQQQQQLDEAAAAGTDDDDRLGRVGRTTNALMRTPGRALSLAASRIPLPASPANVAQAVDRSALAVRERVVSLYEDSGITEVTQATRETLSTVTSIILLVGGFEWYHLRREVLPGRYAFAVPAIRALGTREYPIELPDVFLLATASFWSPVLLYALITIVLPGLLGYFVNLSAASGSHHTGRGRSRPFSTAEYAVDPLTFSVTKALLAYVILGQGVTLGDWVDEVSVVRINSALYGGWQGAVAGAAITGLASLYDAVLRK
ncbi:hypothetical protein SPI_06289 [Niveomyces insectorum RCEF 264]|uniref:Rho termination factor N-terminal domain-containing protein n=1 Tax=Niveomyces insectorum RCEF 264 TaxID=1081102 RepID=A0A167RZH6_9HYPO|nr:hypothetical protein SPI_06289 [Niveomyces insectorum RCEF 264]